MDRARKFFRGCAALLLSLTVLLAGSPAKGAAVTGSAGDQAPEGVWSDSMVIAHRLGVTADGATGTNSREAFLNSCARGVWVMETDFMLTTDGGLAIRHDWNVKRNGKPLAFTTGNHLNTLSQGQYTPLMAGDLLDLMMEYPQVWVVTDTKETDPELVRRQFRLLVEAADAVDARPALDRLVVQVYNTEMKELIEEIYPFENWILTVYLLPGDSDYGALADYCAANGIGTMTMPVTRLTRERAQQIHARGLKLYVHSFNSNLAAPGEIEHALSQGADGIYTSSATDEEVRTILIRYKLSLLEKVFHAAAEK